MKISQQAVDDLFEEIRADSLIPSTYQYMHPGSVQLFHVLALKGNDRKEVYHALQELEGVGDLEPLIGMELYPHNSNEAAEGAAALNFLRGEKRHRILDSKKDAVKWNYRVMPTTHPIFAVLMKELEDYIPQELPTPYMLTIGVEMGRDSVPLLAAWILSHPELIELADYMDREKGDFDFPGSYIGIKGAPDEYGMPTKLSTKIKGTLGGAAAGIFLIRHPAGAVVGAVIGAFASWDRQALYRTNYQTNLYAGIMHPELPPAQDFIRMAGILAKAYTTEGKKDFREFESSFYRTLWDVDLDPTKILRVDDPSSLKVPFVGHYFPGISDATRRINPETAEYIWGNVKHAIDEIERAVYRPEELKLIRSAYEGKLLIS